MSDPASMSPAPDPVGYLGGVVSLLLSGGATDDGLHLPSEQCRSLALGLADVLEGVEIMVALAEAVRGVMVPPPRPPAVSRRELARLATPLDPEGRILAFPGPLTGNPA